MTGGRPAAPAVVGIPAVLGARPRLAGLIGATSLAFSGILFRFSGTSPVTATVFRCLYALPFLALLGRAEDRLSGRRTRAARGLALASGVFFAGDLLAWQHSVELVGAGLATVLANMQVLVVALAGWAILGERPAARVFAGLPLVVAGAVLISGVLDRQAYGADPVLGVVYGLASAVCYAGYLMLIRRANGDGRHGFGALFDASAASTLGAALVGLGLGGLDLVPGWPAHGWLLLVALTSQVLSYGLINVSLPRLPAVATSLLLMFQPATTVVLGAVLLAESPSALQLAGVGCVLGGVAVASGALGEARRAGRRQLSLPSSSA